MKKKYLLPLGIVLVAVCALTLIISGKSYTLSSDKLYVANPWPESADDLTVTIAGAPDEDSPAAECTGISVEDASYSISFRSLRRGRAEVTLYCGTEEIKMFRLYSHAFGVLTYGDYFGDCTGDVVFPAAMIIWLAALLWTAAADYRAGIKRSLYRYRNVLGLGSMIFLSFLLLLHIPMLFDTDGLLSSAEKLLNAGRTFSSVVLPVAFVVSIMMTVSNAGLMRKEGKSWRNMLGIILSVGICVLTLIPIASVEFFQRTTIVDVHNEQGAALYIELFIESFVSFIVTYLECILLGTVIFGIKAARHVPEYDKDHILILGSRIRDDGSLTPLLKARADRALEFARVQEEKTGKKPVFVPSGGQGADEVIAEADAIKNYLLSQGIPEERIISENTSTSTFENIRNSMKLIRGSAGAEAPNVAFSTTNYHVFRAGLIAAEQGENLEGMGSRTKRYFFINSFVREFSALLVSEHKIHIAVFLMLAVFIALLVLVKYLAVIL